MPTMRRRHDRRSRLLLAVPVLPRCVRMGEDTMSESWAVLWILAAMALCVLGVMWIIEHVTVTVGWVT